MFVACKSVELVSIHNARRQHRHITDPAISKKKPQERESSQSPRPTLGASHGPESSAPDILTSLMPPPDPIRVFLFDRSFHSQTCAVLKRAAVAEIQEQRELLHEA